MPFVDDGCVRNSHKHHRTPFARGLWVFTSYYYQAWLFVPISSPQLATNRRGPSDPYALGYTPTWTLNPRPVSRPLAAPSQQPLAEVFDMHPESALVVWGLKVVQRLAEAAVQELLHVGPDH